jgi:hypothetical protein
MTKEQFEINFSEEDKIQKESIEREEVAGKYGADKTKLLKTEDKGWCILEDLTNVIVPIKEWYQKKEKEVEKEKEKEKEKLEKMKKEKEEDKDLQWFQR